jgi:hypothetical protein
LKLLIEETVADCRVAWSDIWASAREVTTARKLKMRK